MSTLYVLVLNGKGPRKIHAPDCNWVASTVKEAYASRPKRQYVFVPADTVTRANCRRCVGVPGPRP